MRNILPISSYKQDKMFVIRKLLRLFGVKTDNLKILI